MDMDNQISVAIDELREARRNESYADPEFIDVAIQSTNVAAMRLNNLMKIAKLRVKTGR